MNFKDLSVLKRILKSLRNKYPKTDIEIYHGWTNKYGRNHFYYICVSELNIYMSKEFIRKVKLIRKIHESKLSKKLVFICASNKKK